MVKTALILSVIHLCYYAYFQLISDFIRMGSQTEFKHKELTRLISTYKVNIRTFQKNSNLHGFAWFRSIYLNENLFKSANRKYKALKWVFHHEHYHLMNKHKQKVLLMRLLFSATPLLLIVHWIPFIVVYVLFAYFMDYARKLFEKNANKHASDMMEIEMIKKNES